MTRCCWFALALLAGCGISDSKLLVDLSADDLTKLCGEFDDATYTCTGATATYTINLAAADCVSSSYSDTCTATVGDLRNCNADTRAVLEADACGLTELPATCSWAVDCADMTTMTGTTM